MALKFYLVSQLDQAMRDEEELVRPLVLEMNPPAPRGHRFGFVPPEAKAAAAEVLGAAKE